MLAYVPAHFIQIYTVILIFSENTKYEAGLSFSILVLVRTRNELSCSFQDANFFLLDERIIVIISWTHGLCPVEYDNCVPYLINTVF